MVARGAGPELHIANHPKSGGGGRGAPQGGGFEAEVLSLYLLEWGGVPPPRDIFSSHGHDAGGRACPAAAARRLYGVGRGEAATALSLRACVCVCTETLTNY